MGLRSRGVSYPATEGAENRLISVTVSGLRPRRVLIRGDSHFRGSYLRKTASKVTVTLFKQTSTAPGYRPWSNGA